jgi:hypothetical protein
MNNSASSTKDALINKGPVSSGISNHAMALVGYKTIEEGDYVRHYTDDDEYTDVYVTSGSPLIGETIWIYKNSYGTDWGEEGGYLYAFKDYSTSNSSNEIVTPVYSLNYSDNDIRCTDNDNDGYCWWGIGSKPSSCNCLCCAPEPDGDDSNPNLGPMDNYGNCQAITTPYCCPTEVTSTETWTTTRNDCGGVVVKSGGNLTLYGATINLPDGKTFAVETGGTLTFNQGIIQ